MSKRIRALWLRLPRWTRNFAIDFAEGAVGAVVVLNLFIPKTLTEVAAQAAIIGAAVASPAVAAFRRHFLPAAWAWLRETFAPAPGD